MRGLLAGLLVLALLAPVPAAAQAEDSIGILAPASGDVLRGMVNIIGTSAVDGFVASELAFAYASDPTSGWFLIYATDQPVSNGLLAAWDTAFITDGDYDLRLRVTLQDGMFIETLVTGLHIRNLAATETATPKPTFTPTPTNSPIVRTDSPPTSAPATPVISVPTFTPRSTPTPFPPNPASVTPSAIYFFLGRGILIALFTFLIVAIFLRLRRS